MDREILDALPDGGRMQHQLEDDPHAPLGGGKDALADILDADAELGLGEKPVRAKDVERFFQRVAGDALRDLEVADLVLGGEPVAVRSLDYRPRSLLGDVGREDTRGKPRRVLADFALNAVGSGAEPRLPAILFLEPDDDVDVIAVANRQARGTDLRRAHGERADASVRPGSATLHPAIRLVPCHARNNSVAPHRVPRDQRNM